ncbi:MAG: hypothetical protein Q8K26_03435 [Candidatus Gracilibacteria bacterium]|nr:hypothetical protein [Candidatus Gracilibacteria bacterium]
MGAGDYTPSSSGRMKPVTRAQLRKMQQDYELADKIREEALLKEQAEKVRVAGEVDDMLTDVF